jgi:ABC-type lipopolysaccharide export system ATPase subunit
VLVIDGIATARGSVNFEDHNVTQDFMRERESMECIYDSGKAHAGSLTTNKGNILSYRQREEETSEKTPLRREGDTELVGCNKYGIGDMRQLMGTEAAGGRSRVEVCDFGKPPIGDWAPSKGSIPFSNKRAIVTNENS